MQREESVVSVTKHAKPGTSSTSQMRATISIARDKLHAFLGGFVRQLSTPISYCAAACEFVRIVWKEHAELSAINGITSDAMQRWRSKFYSELAQVQVEAELGRPQDQAQRHELKAHDEDSDEDNTPRTYIPFMQSRYIPALSSSVTKAEQVKREQAKVLNPEPRCPICLRDLSIAIFLIDSPEQETTHLACKVARLVEKMLINPRKSIPEIHSKAEIWTDELNTRLKAVMDVSIPKEGAEAASSVSRDSDLLASWRWLMTATKVASIHKELDELHKFGKLDDLFAGFPDMTARQRLEISRAAITGVANIMREQGFTGETTRRSICAIAACLILDLGESQKINFRLNPEAAAAAVVGIFQPANKWFTGQAHRLVCGLAKVDARVAGWFPAALDMQRSSPLLAKPADMIKFWLDMKRAAATFATSEEDQLEMAASFYGATILCGNAQDYAARRDPPRLRQRPSVEGAKAVEKLAEEQVHGDNKRLRISSEEPELASPTHTARSSTGSSDGNTSW